MSNDRFTVSFGARTVPAMLFTLSMASTRALMCREPELEAEYRSLYEALASQFGVGDILSKVDEAEWFRACQAMAAASDFFWYVETESWRLTGNGKVSLVVDGVEFRLGKGIGDLTEDMPGLDGLRELVERHAKVDAVRGEDRRAWGRYVAEESPSP